jgi:hypothetical protein
VGLYLGEEWQPGFDVLRHGISLGNSFNGTILGLRAKKIDRLDMTAPQRLLAGVQIVRLAGFATFDTVGHDGLLLHFCLTDQRLTLVSQADEMKIAGRAPTCPAALDFAKSARAWNATSPVAEA